MRRLMHGGFESRGALEDALLLAVVETGVPIWALDDATLDGPLGIREARSGEQRPRPDGFADDLPAGAPRGRRRRWAGRRRCSASRTPGMPSRAARSGFASSRFRSAGFRTCTSRRRSGRRSKPAGRGRARLGAVVVLIDPYAQDLTLGLVSRAGRAGRAAHAARIRSRASRRQLADCVAIGVLSARWRGSVQRRGRLRARVLLGIAELERVRDDLAGRLGDARRALTARGARAGARACAAGADAARARPAQVRARRRWPSWARAAAASTTCARAWA